MVLPIGDAPNPRGTPLVSYLLIAANLVVYGLYTFPLSGTRASLADPATQEYLRVLIDALGSQASLPELQANATAYDVLVFSHGFRPSAPSVVDLFTCMFLHAGILHLVGNMLFIWIYGDNVEQALGPLRYLAAYLGSGIAASLFHALFAFGSPLPLIGASGAISGVLGLYFVWFPQNRVRLLWLFPPFFFHVFELRARLVLGFYLLVDNLLPFLVVATASGVAHGAHIGGFLAGVLGARWANRRALGFTSSTAAEK